MCDEEPRKYVKSEELLCFLPTYRTKSLNLSSKEKLPGRIGFAIYILTTLLFFLPWDPTGLQNEITVFNQNATNVSCIIEPLKKTPDPFRSFLLMIFLVFIGAFFVMIQTYTNSFVQQVVSGRLMFLTMAAIYLFWAILIQCFNYDVNQRYCRYDSIRVIAAFGIHQFLWSLSALLFGIKYCRCKTCANQFMDVKIYYQDKCIETSEIERISYATLITVFDLPDLHENAISFHLENGEHIYSLNNENSYVQLHEGTYFVKVENVMSIKIYDGVETKIVSEKTKFTEKKVKEMFGLKKWDKITLYDEQGRNMLSVVNKLRLTMYPGIYYLVVIQNNANPYGEAPAKRSPPNCQSMQTSYLNYSRLIEDVNISVA